MLSAICIPLPSVKPHNLHNLSLTPYSDRYQLQSSQHGCYWRQTFHRFTSLKSGQSSISSTTNQLYATINRLTEWPLPEGLGGYHNLPADLLYSSIDPNPAIQVIGEQDAVWAARSYIVTPVELVLYHNSPYTI